jgi:DNA adenine methylase
LKVLAEPHVKQAWFNDLDFGIYALWESVRTRPAELISLVEVFIPTTAAFYKFKDYLLDIPEGDKAKYTLSIGFEKLTIHQISYSGLGTKSGGPLGGEDQSSEYKIDCRWSPEQLTADIRAAHDLMKQKEVKVTCEDFESLIRGRRNHFLYLDPPYYVKGPELYQCSFTPEDHERLARSLRETTHPWLLSYDDCKEIRKLYKFAVIQEVPLNYTINGAVTKTELLIAPKGLKRLVEERTENFSVL